MNENDINTLKMNRSDLIWIVQAMQLIEPLGEKDTLEQIHNMREVIADSFRYFAFVGSTLAEDLDCCIGLAVQLNQNVPIDDLKHEIRGAFVEIEKCINAVQAAILEAEINKAPLGVVEQATDELLAIEEGQPIDEELQRAIDIRNKSNGKTSWPDICEQVTGVRDGFRSFSNRVRAYAEMNEQHLPMPGPGTKPNR